MANFLCDIQYGGAQLATKLGLIRVVGMIRLLLDSGNTKGVAK
jgi:hypothetical protein